jgi:hypothetical protein
MYTKLKWPISGMVASILGLLYYETPALAFLMAGLVGIYMEIIIAVVILTALMSGREFKYDSWMGWLLNQYIIVAEVSMTDIVTLIAARTFCFALIIFPPIWGTLWLLLPVFLYLLFTCVLTVDTPNEDE